MVMVMVMKVPQAGAGAAAAKAAATGEWDMARVVCCAIQPVHNNTPGAVYLHQLDPPLALNRPLHHKRHRQQQQQQQQPVLISRLSVNRSSHHLMRPHRAHHRLTRVHVSLFCPFIVNASPLTWKIVLARKSLAFAASTLPASPSFSARHVSSSPPLRPQPERTPSPHIFTHLSTKEMYLGANYFSSAQFVARPIFSG